MDHDRYRVRPFAPVDLAAQARLDEQIDPGFARTAEEIQHWQETEAVTPGHFTLKQGVEDRHSGAVVAYGDLSHTSFNFHPDKYWIEVAVDPAHQGQGIGSELYGLLEREAVRRGAVCLWSSVRDDDARSVLFYDHRGFSTLRKTWRSRLDLAEAPRGALPDRAQGLANQGIEITTVAAEGSQRPEVRRRLYELSRVASRDVPRLGEYSGVSFEQFVRIDLEQPTALLEGFFVARHGEAYVGMTTVEREPSRPDSLHVGFTGIHPDFRGRGIASELKRQAVEFARARGARYLVTYNDSLNAPIWAINERIGFRRLVTWRMGEKALWSTGHAL